MRVLLILLAFGCSKPPLPLSQQQACAAFATLDATVKAKGGAVNRETKRQHRALDIACKGGK